MDEFLHENNLKCIVKDKTCFKNPDNPSSIDLFLTNFSNCFQNTTAICTGLSDFHKMIVTVQKYSFVKAGPRVTRFIHSFFSCLNSILESFGIQLTSVTKLNR